MTEHYMDDTTYLEEAHYYWVLSELCDLIREQGYSKVMKDIEGMLTTEDLEVTVMNTLE
jgi:hypothetical protein